MRTVPFGDLTRTSLGLSAVLVVPVVVFEMRPRSRPISVICSATG